MPKVGHGPFKTSLLTRNVIVNGRRTSIRLGPRMWDAVDRIAEREKVALCEIMAQAKRRHSSGAFTAAVREFTVEYWMNAAEPPQQEQAA